MSWLGSELVELGFVPLKLILLASQHCVLFLSHFASDLCFALNSVVQHCLGFKSLTTVRLAITFIAKLVWPEGFSG